MDDGKSPYCLLVKSAERLFTDSDRIDHIDLIALEIEFVGIGRSGSNCCGGESKTPEIGDDRGCDHDHRISCCCSRRD
ncbi:hypothetical protein D3C81_1423830 [compost metagenome]